MKRARPMGLHGALVAPPVVRFGVTLRQATDTVKVAGAERESAGIEIA
jgi:hypothetical protein